MPPDYLSEKTYPPLLPAWFAVFILGAGGVVSWLQLPLAGRVSGLKLSIWASWFSFGIPGCSVFSFGGLSLLLALLAGVGLLSTFRYEPWLWFSLGTGGWFLIISFLGNLVCRPDDLFYLLDQRQQLSIAIQFANNFCEGAYPTNSLYDSTFNFLDLSLVCLLPQFAGILDFISWGIAFLAIAASMMFFLGFSLCPRARYQRWVTTLVLAFLIFTGLCVRPSVLMDRQMRMACDALSLKNYQQASQILEQMANRHPSLWNWPPFLYLLGEAHDFLGEESPVRHFYLGAKLMPSLPPLSDLEQTNLSRRFQEWSLASATKEPKQRSTVLHLLGWALLWDGMQKYAASQSPAALHPWQQAQDLAPRLLPTSLFLAKGYLDLRMDNECLAEVSRFLPGCRFDFLKSLAQSLAGDACYQRGLVWEARRYYEQSMKSYHTSNTRAYKGLSGQ